ncbi:MAG: hypothetical protein NVS2B9_12490 [Myxococcales bacterium]
MRQVESTAPTRETLDRFRSGDPVAFEAVIRAHAPVVRAVVAKLWRSVFEQEEAMQEIWVHAFRRRASLDAGRPESFRAWLTTLARNRALDLLRATARRAEVPQDAEDASWEPSSAAALQHHAAEELELRMAVERFVAGLKPTWRSFFELHFVQGLEYAAVAEQLSISRLRCKYMRKVLAARAQRNPQLMAALGRSTAAGDDAS